jgi:membrane protease YdiL (CAAX protease family)
MKISDLLRKHQLISFFALTYAITWGLWIPFGILYFQKNLIIAGAFMTWGAFGPALAGIIITRITIPKRVENGRKAPLLAFFIGLLVSALIIILVEWPPEKVGGLIVMGLIAAVPPAFVISSTFSQNQNVRKYLNSLIKPRGSLIYYLFALLIQPFTFWIGSVISNILGLSVYSTPTLLNSMGRGEAVIVILILFIYQFFYGNVLGEEVGWRGFALPRLQARFSPLFASLIIASIWFPWHLPLKIMNPDVLPYLFYGLTFIPGSIILTWIYNRTEGSILAVGIEHVALNVSGKFLFPITDGYLVANIIVAIILIISYRMWEKVSSENSSDIYSAIEDGTYSTS